jgi:hypothetical protein
MREERKGVVARFLHREEDCPRFRTLNAIILRRLDRAALAYVRAGGIDERAGFTNGIRDTER